MFIFIITYEYLFCNLYYTPILELHYKLLAKSKYDIKKDYYVTFDPIDQPSEKERAEIREINARTDAAYINAGVISAEEIRNVLREDEQSGYSALGDEPVEDDPSDDEIDFGGSKNLQDFFSQDEEPKDWITSKGTHIPIKKGQTKNEGFEERFY